MGNASSKPASHTNPKQLQTYQTLLNMGFDDNMSFTAAQRFPDNTQKAVEHILTNHNTMKSAHTMNKVSAQEEKRKSNIFDDVNINTGCACDRRDCNSIKRVKSLLVLYNINIEDPSSFLDKLTEQIGADYTITDIINDYIHIVQIHCDTDENFEDVYASLNIRCTLNNCIGLQRNQRHEKLKNTNAITDLMDQIHSYLLHTFDTGCRLTKRERQILNKNKDSHGLFHQINDLLKDRRKRFLNINTTQSPSHHSKFVTHIHENKANTNEDDSKQNNQCDNISNDVYSLSHRFNYWERHKDLSVTPIHQNLKEEIVNNKLFTFTVNEYEVARNKAEQFLKSDKAKSLKFKYTNYGSLQGDYRANIVGINNGSGIVAHHLIALILYTDFDLLSFNFSSTFRKSRDNENMKKLIERHRNYYWFGRYLREAVEGYGEKAIDLKHQILYHGVSTPLIFASVIAQFYHPTSTTKDITVAQQFATNAGIVISLTKHRYLGNLLRLTLPCFDCEWLSRFPWEREVLFDGGLYYFQILNIIECSTGQQHKSYLRAMAFIHRAMDGGYNRGIDTTDEAIIMKLIAHDKAVPNYILRMFDVYRQKKSSVLIRHSQYLSSLFFSDPTSIKTSFINLEIIQSLFPKCERIFLIKDLDAIEFTLQYVKQIISELAQNQWDCLGKITIGKPWIKSKPSETDFYKATKFDICIRNNDVIIQRRSSKNK